MCGKLDNYVEESKMEDSLGWCNKLKSSKINKTMLIITLFRMLCWLEKGAHLSLVQHHKKK